MSRPRRIPARRGFTLIEVILAMALTAVVLLIVAAGIGVQLRAFATSRARVERAQLARVLLHRMADDLRGLLPPGDAAGHAPEAETSNGEEPSTSEDNASATTSDSSDDATEEVDAGDEDSEVSESVPGVYGELDWLRIDVVQAARPSTSSYETSAPSAESEPPLARQIKTITYYVVPPQQGTAAALSAGSGESGGGLVRHELVGPAAARVAELGLLEYRDQQITPLAAEVEAVEFRYHDGDDWVESWDTAVCGTLPSAIEIRLFLSPIPQRDNRPAGSVGGTSEDPAGLPHVQYRLIVPITIESASQSTMMGVSEESSEGSEESSEEEGSSTESGSTGDADKPGGTR